MILQSALQIAFVAAHNGPVVEGEGAVGLEADGLVVVLQRTIQVLFFVARVAPVGERCGTVGLEADGLVVILQRTVQVSLVAACVTSIGESLGIVGLESDGLIEILQRALQVAFVTARGTSVVKCLGIAGLDPDGVAVETLLLVRISRVKPSLKPLLCRQFDLRNRWCRLSRSPLFCSGSPRRGGCGMQHRFQRHIQEFATQPLHGGKKVLGPDA